MPNRPPPRNSAGSSRESTRPSRRSAPRIFGPARTLGPPHRNTAGPGRLRSSPRWRPRSRPRRWVRSAGPLGLGRSWTQSWWARSSSVLRDVLLEAGRHGGSATVAISVRDGSVEVEIGVAGTRLHRTVPARLSFGVRRPLQWPLGCRFCLLRSSRIPASPLFPRRPFSASCPRSGSSSQLDPQASRRSRQVSVPSFFPVHLASLENRIGKEGGRNAREEYSRPDAHRTPVAHTTAAPTTAPTTTDVRPPHVGVNPGDHSAGNPVPQQVPANPEHRGADPAAQHGSPDHRAPNTENHTGVRPWQHVDAHNNDHRNGVPRDDHRGAFGEHRNDFGHHRWEGRDHHELRFDDHDGRQTRTGSGIGNTTTAAMTDRLGGRTWSCVRPTTAPTATTTSRRSSTTATAAPPARHRHTGPHRLVPEERGDNGSTHVEVTRDWRPDHDQDRDHDRQDEHRPEHRQDDHRTRADWREHLTRVNQRHGTHMRPPRQATTATTTTGRTRPVRPPRPGARRRPRRPGQPRPGPLRRAPRTRRNGAGPARVRGRTGRVSRSSTR